MNTAAWLSLSSAVAFAAASIVFTLFARKISALWMNAFKGCMALISFFVVLLFTKDYSVVPNFVSVACFFMSGFIGLNLADFFMVRSYRIMGPARTLMIFSFQPVFLGVFAYLIFGQHLSWVKVSGIGFMILCVFVMSYERFRADRKWEITGPLMAFVGMLLDGCGILITRKAFELDPSITSIEGNFYRCVGACVGFYIFSLVFPYDLKRTYLRLSFRAKLIVISGGILGTFVSLWMYLKAISIGNLATVSAIVGTAPVFAAIFESIAARKKPTAYLITALIFFLAGFSLVAFTSN